MVAKDVLVNVKGGLTSKTAAVFIQKANSYKCQLLVDFSDHRVNAKSLLGVLSLEIPNGSTIKITADGEQEEEALESLSKILQLRDPFC